MWFWLCSQLTLVTADSCRLLSSRSQHKNANDLSASHTFFGISPFSLSIFCNLVLRITLELTLFRDPSTFPPFLEAVPTPTLSAAAQKFSSALSLPRALPTFGLFYAATKHCPPVFPLMLLNPISSFQVVQQVNLMITFFF